jgi:hypothetical protein
MSSALLMTTWPHGHDAARPREKLSRCKQDSISWLNNFWICRSFRRRYWWVFLNLAPAVSDDKTLQRRCWVSSADIPQGPRHVRFTLRSRNRSCLPSCQLCANNGSLRRHRERPTGYGPADKTNKITPAHCSPPRQQNAAVYLSARWKALASSE